MKAKLVLNVRIFKIPGKPGYIKVIVKDRGELLIRDSKKLGRILC